MLNRDKTGLLIFDNFQIDFHLPKYNGIIEKVEAMDEEAAKIVANSNIRTRRRFVASRGNSGVLGALTRPDNVPNQAFIAIGNTIITPDGFSTNEIVGAIGSYNPTKISIWDRIFSRKKIAERKKEILDAQTKPNFSVSEVTEPAEQISMSVEEFFVSVKNTTEQITIIKDRLKNYENSIKHLSAAGQTALLEIMLGKLEIIRAETQLFALNLTKCITEDNVIEFAKKSSKSIKLDWVQNYTRCIPKKLIDVKIDLDGKGVFDNYVVMHYDPDGTGTELTDQQKKDKEDPILFGVVAGSQKLYFVGDWVDKYCDLTFDKLVETLGEEAVNANDITAKVCVPTAL